MKHADQYLKQSDTHMEDVVSCSFCTGVNSGNCGITYHVWHKAPQQSSPTSSGAAPLATETLCLPPAKDGTHSETQLMLTDEQRETQDDSCVYEMLYDALRS